MKVTPRLDGDCVHVLLEWVRIADERVAEVVHTEEFRIAHHRVGCAYVSAVRIAEAVVQPGSFWLDELGLRHFVVKAEVGAFNMTGGSSGNSSD